VSWVIKSNKILDYSTRFPNDMVRLVMVNEDRKTAVRVKSCEPWFLLRPAGLGDFKVDGCNKLVNI